MFRIFFSLIIISVCIRSNAQSDKQYCNERFSFCITYPRQFTPLPPPENGDGQRFVSTDKKATILTFGSLAIEDFDSLGQEYAQASKNTAVSYKRIAKDWFIFSGKNSNGNIVYRKTRKMKIDYMDDKKTAVFQTLMIEYPAGQAVLYEAYCKQIANSLK